MEELNLYKELYLFELERKDRLTGSISTPVSLIIAVVVAWTYILSLITDPINNIKISIFILFSFSFMLVIFSVIFLINQNFGYKYGYLQTPEKLKRYRLDLEDYFKKFGDQVAGKNSDSEFLTYMVEQFVSHTSRNGKNNDERSGYIYRSNLFLALSLLPLGVGYILLVVGKLNHVI
ncbi:hypothetical protein [Mesorhizobium sp. WSM4305]|uniref:hypothetical protein n=1 Tax=Mesorhizobium sp. WSM4305 TaxID=2589886 RepID=UPI00115E7520|nr:hypothetical protein [Mesorhizobium sp. WSM4305]TRC94398.1 hypothetical protein FJV82_29505 [Mesorhizobium sp. WSM4305]